MEKNKSIDGLRVRAAKSPSTTKSPKKVTKSKSPVTKTASKKASATKSVSTKTPKPISPKHVDSPTTPNSANIPTDSPKSTTPKPSADPVEDFLKPIQAFDFDEATGELKVAKNQPTKPTNQMSSEKPQKSHKKRKIIITIIIILFLIIAGVATGFILWGNDIIAKITGGQGTVFDLIKFTEPTYEPLKNGSNGRTNILAFGTSGYNMEGDEGRGKHDGAQLTDSIMVISLNQDNGDIAMLSLPRDLKASPTCTATGKINEVYWCNNMRNDNEKAGAEALMTEVGSILGLDFQYYAHLNWGSLIQIVDILGGINVTLDEDINDYYWTKAVYKANVEYTLNGEQALGLARARHGTTGGDFSRGASQQKILIGIKDKLLSKNLSISEIMGLASSLGDNLRTNFSIDEMKTLAHLSSNFDFNNMRQVSLLEPRRLMTTGNINGISYVLPSAGVGNYSKIQSYVSEMFSSDPRVYENPSILVLNSLDTVGLASAEKDKLEKAGYTNIATDNTTATAPTEEYTLYSLTSTAPGTKKLLEKEYNLTAKSLDELPEGISRDYTFVIVIGGERKTESE